MVDWSRIKNWTRNSSIIIIFGTLFFGIAFIAYLRFGNIGLTAVDIAISGVLTAALVYLYSQQKDLFTHQMNREARQHHTEALRERVQKWHGNPERLPPEEGSKTIGNRRENLPQILGASFESAQNVGKNWDSIDSRHEFHVVPRELRDDPYFEDLLENHASDLKETKQNIKQLYEDFRSLRSKFCDEFSDGITEQKQDYVIKPHDLLPEWLFGLIVLSSRNRLYEDECLTDRAISEIKDNDTSPIVPDESALRFYAGMGHKSTPVYRVEFDDIDDKEIQERRELIESEVLDIVQRITAGIDENEPYTYARKASEILDEAENEIEKLDNLLIEYYGRPVYGGDCKYLKESRV